MNRMVWSSICIAMLSATTAYAEDLATAVDPLPPGVYTGTPHSDEWKIKNALSAGPPFVTNKAAVVDMDAKMNMRTLRAGTNGWTCMPDIPNRPQHDPMCADETTMK